MKPTKKELFPHTVTELKHITQNIYTLSFARQFDFIPGQVVAISIDDELEPRLYSIASGNKADDMRILFDIHNQGQLTPQLAKLSAGSQLLVSEPFGKFIPSDDEQCWIATGTGIAPFIAMLESGVALPQNLIHGARKLDLFLFQQFFSAQLGDRYLRFCTSESAPHVISGRLTQWIKDQEALPTDIKYYLCGNPEMVVQVRDLLLEKSISYADIMAEIYF